MAKFKTHIGWGVFLAIVFWGWFKLSIILVGIWAGYSWGQFWWWVVYIKKDIGGFGRDKRLLRL